MQRKPELFITYLGEQHDNVLLALADRGVRHFANIARGYEERVAQHLNGLGARVISLESLVPDREKLEEQTAMHAQAERIAAILRSRPLREDPRIPVSSGQLHEIVAETVVGDRLAHSRILIRALDRLAREFDVRATLVYGDVSRESRVLIRWSKAAGVPTFHLHHGANLGRARGIYAQSLCDYVLLYGRRGGDPYLDSGVAVDELVLAGAPGWDGYPGMLAQRDQIRRTVREQCGVARDAPIVTFAVTTFQMALSLVEIQIAGRTLHTFLAGARSALDAGAAFTIIIKDRMHGGHTGRPLIEEKAQALGLDVLYTDGKPAPLNIASDVLVACDSNMSLEATLCGVPTINIWSPMTWIDGPYYAAQDNILQARYDEPELLGGYIRRLLDDPVFRNETVHAAQEAVRDIVYEADGGAARRCAAFVLEKTASAGGASSQ